MDSWLLMGMVFLIIIIKVRMNIFIMMTFWMMLFLMSSIIIMVRIIRSLIISLKMLFMNLTVMILFTMLIIIYNYKFNLLSDDDDYVSFDENLNHFLSFYQYES